MGLNRGGHRPLPRGRAAGDPLPDPPRGPAGAARPSPADGPCSCRDAVAWREYWSGEALAVRLEAELEALRAARASMRDQILTEMSNDIRTGFTGRWWDIPAHDELERRRKEPGPRLGVMFPKAYRRAK